MAKEFKVLEDVEIDGKEYKADDTVSLEDAESAPLVESGKLEAAEESKE